MSAALAQPEPTTMHHIAEGTAGEVRGSRLLRQRSCEPDPTNLRLAGLVAVLLAWRGVVSLGRHGQLRMFSLGGARRTSAVHALLAIPLLGERGCIQQLGVS